MSASLAIFAISVHPHVRGDGVDAGGTLVDTIGSPPRAWGRRQDIAAGDAAGRFTPTCVGTAILPKTWKT